MPERADRAVAVVIPAFQAAAAIAAVVSRTSRAVPGATVYVVDDGSTDGTRDAGRELGATVLVHPQNRGKGAALTTGIAAALDAGAGVIVTLDADGQHPPEEIPGLAAPVLGDEADLALGCRARTGTMPWGRRCTNWLSAALASRIGGVGVPDAQTGFRALSRRVAQAVRPREQGYDFETAFLLAALAQGLRVRFVPVSTVYEGRPSHFRPWVDTWRQARVFARYRGAIIFGAR
ncbi:MAG: glycosyltransferase family 2 protein [Gemmatimonadetes bacterium]|jgi:glycosyltransferase involved in cell wall biosynthesis|nr:MAG: glycosyltransferase family 2 protein [Gemmatimonadota bacterium]